MRAGTQTPIPLHDSRISMARTNRPSHAKAFISWRFVLVGAGMLGLVGVGIAAFAWVSG